MDELKMIRKHYGEKMMHLCRELFPTILETPGLLYSLLESKFAPNHYLYDDIVKYNLKLSFKNFIYSLMDDFLERVETDKTPFELMEEAGYTLYECKSEEDIQMFKKYYADGEELCTFTGGRINNCHVFFAVKKNVDEINRKDFLHPERQDEYGTSVISIQFSRGGVNTLSIKNRYNHRVTNPDATYANNLDNIIPGLSFSFEKYYGLNINQSEGNGFEIPGYVLANYGKYYKYNYEIHNVYYCPDNIIIDNFQEIRDYQEKEKYIIADYFIIDLEKKEVRLYNNIIGDSFLKGLQDIEKIDVVRNRDNGNKIVTLTPKDGSEIVIEIDKFNRIVGYRNHNLVEIRNNFLRKNETLAWLDIPNVRLVTDRFLEENIALVGLDLPNLVIIGDNFLSNNQILRNINIPKVTSIGNDFLSENQFLMDLNLPELRVVENSFLLKNRILMSLNAPELNSVGNAFLSENNALVNLSLPSLVDIGTYFLELNNTLVNLDLPKLRFLGMCALYCNNTLISLSLPNLEKVGLYCLFSNHILKELYVPKLMTTSRLLGGRTITNVVFNINEDKDNVKGSR